MNRLRSFIDWFQDVMGVGRVRADDQAKRHQLWIGALAGVTVVVVAAALGLLYLKPLGHTEYTANFENSSGVRTGDQVRIAGILVGQVTSLDIEGDHVKVRLSVEDDVHVGVDSSIAVRLLTPVGGRYLQLAPKGSRPLGGGIIPPERVTGTYDLTSLLEEVTPKAAELDGAKLRDLLTGVERGIRGQPKAATRILDNASSLTEQFARRSDQLKGALKVSDEYVRATAEDRQVLFALVRSLGEIGVELGVRHEQVRRVFNLLTKLFQFFERPATAYADVLEGPVNDIADILERLEPRVEKVDASMNAVEHALGRVKGLVGGDGSGLTVDHGAQTLTGMTLCIPSVSRGC
ncbi:MlaD family protein [Gordonia sp. MP11Mi]|uniref:Mce/MlaD domain-containing protein n=1 Tax=Gordonia sp. MP11Mi TaxID=3022769 RepID=A0AA97GVP0_9ACTN